jgi:hypothetical protein
MRTTGTVQPFEKEYFRKDGSRVPVLVGGATLDERGDAVVVFAVDLTERKRAEAELAHGVARPITIDLPWNRARSGRMAAETISVFQFIALQKGLRQAADDGRHFGLVVDNKELSRSGLVMTWLPPTAVRFMMIVASVILWPTRNLWSATKRL